MIRLGLAALIALAGCGGDDGSATMIDARVDAIPIDGDRDAMPRVCEASPPTPTQPTTGGAVIGGWALTWSCANGCIGNRPGLTYAHHADITIDAIAYSSSGCPRCTLTHAAAPSIAGCVDVEAGADWDAQCRFSYRLCERSGTIEALVTWKEPGLDEQTWKVVGVPD